MKFVINKSIHTGWHILAKNVIIELSSYIELIKIIWTILE